MTARRQPVSLRCLARCSAMLLVCGSVFWLDRPACGQSGSADQTPVEARVVALTEAGRYGQALEIARRHLESERKRHGEGHPETLGAANLVGLAQLGQGDAGEARAVFERVLQGYRKLHGQRHVLTAEALNNLGVALFHEGQWPRACQVLDQAYAQRKALLGQLHVDTLQSLANLAGALRRCGQEVPAEYVRWVDEELLAANDDWIEQDRADDDVDEESPFAWEDDFFGTELGVFWDDREARSVGPAATSVDLFEVREKELPAPRLVVIGGVLAGRTIFIPDHLRTFAAVRVFERAGQMVPAVHAVWLVPWETIAEIKAEVFGAKHLQTLLAEHNMIASQGLGDGAGGAFLPDMEDDDPIDEQLRQASPLARLERLLSAVGALVGQSHRLTAALHQNLGIALAREAEHATGSRQHLQTARDIFASRMGEAHPWTAAAAENLGLACYYARDFSEAIPYLENATGIRRQAFGDDHPLVAQSLNSLGIARYELGEFEAARECIQEALDIRAAVGGPLDSKTLRSLNDLAVVLRAQGDYAAAARYLELALERLTEWERTQAQELDTSFEWDYQPRFLDREVLENNLGVLRFEMGDYDAARRHLETVLRDDPDGWLAGQALLNLGSLARLEGRLGEARKLFQRRLQHNPTCQLALHNLGAIARDAGDFETATEYLGKVLEQRRQQQGDQHPDVAFSSIALALLDQRRGDYETAEERLKAALEIYTAAYGPGDPKTTQVLRIRGENALLAGRRAEAVARLDRALENKLRLADDVLPVLSEAEAIAYVLAHRERDLLLAALAGGDHCRRAYEVVWKTRALATQTIAARQKIVRHGEANQVAAELQNVRSKLAAQIRAWYLFDIPDLYKRSRAYCEETLLRLQQQKERLERKLAELSPPDQRRQELQRVDSRQFLTRLPADIAVVDIVRVQRPGPATGDASQAAESDYQAFVLLGGSPPDRSDIVGINLGDARPIDAAVAAWRRQIDLRQGGVRRGRRWQAEPLPAPPREPNAILRETVWEKIQPHLAGRKTVVLIPDGMLARVPWAALPGEEPGKYLIEEGVAIATATHPRQILDLLQAEAPRGNQHLLVGGVDYDSAPGETLEDKIPERYAASTRGAPGRANRHWKKLPASGKEVQSAKELVPPGQPLVVLTDAAASKAAVVEALPASRFVLLATHGFFAPPEYLSALDTAGRGEATDPQMLAAVQKLFRFSELRPSVLTSIAGRNPLTLSGLVLAGANRQLGRDALGAPQDDDGILTAEEIAGLQLAGTELVVLSACATGLGELVGGEGVFGLQRAFALAGARTVIASLWDVDDEATRALMTEFYRELWRNRRGKLEALARAQRAMIRRYDRQAGRVRQPDDRSTERDEPPPLSPYYWAAFSLSGDWR